MQSYGEALVLTKRIFKWLNTPFLTSFYRTPEFMLIKDKTKQQKKAEKQIQLATLYTVVRGI